MYSYSSFRGLAGEVVAGFVRPGIFITALPVLGYWLIVGIGLFFLAGKINGAALPILLLLVSAPLVGRFAVASTNGDIHSGFFSTRVGQGEIMGFTIRYAVLTASWVTVVALIMYFSFKGSESMIGMTGIFNAASLAQLGIKGILLIIVTVICLFAPTLCFLLATVTDSVGEAFSPNPWRWLYHFRLQDVLVFYCSLFGGIIVFYAVWAIPMVVLIAIAFAVSSKLGAFIAGYVYIFPALAAPILIGRLCGAFAIGEDEMEDSMEQKKLSAEVFSDPEIAKASALSMAEAAKETPSSAGAAASTSIPPNPNARAFSAANALKVVKSTSKEALSASIGQRKQQLETDSQDMQTAVELALLLRKAGELQELAQVAEKALELAVINTSDTACVVIFRSIKNEREKLSLDAPLTEKVGALLLQQKQYADGGWCQHQALIKKGAEPVVAQKKLIEIAEIASQAGKPKEAYSLYSFFIKTYPQSSFIDFVSKEAENEKRKAEQG